MEKEQYTPVSSNTNSKKTDDPDSEEFEPCTTADIGYPTTSLNYQVVAHKYRYMSALFLLGVFNNNGYTLVQSGSSSLAKAFGKEDFMAVF